MGKKIFLSFRGIFPLLILIIGMGVLGVWLWEGKNWSAAPVLSPSPHVCAEERLLVPTDPPMEGKDVEELQSRLKELGLYKGSVDGVYRGETVAAIRRLQQAKGLPADGHMTSQVWQLLAGPEEHQAHSKTTLTAPRGPVHIVVDLKKMSLTLYSEGQPFKEYPIACGKPATPSPVGEFKVNDKAAEWSYDLGSRWIGISASWGRYGIHGTSKPWSIGSRASAGCIRMYNHHVEELYEWVSVGTPVKIINGDLPSVLAYPPYSKGQGGQDVVVLQGRLRERGYALGSTDGIYGQATEDAVKKLEGFYGLSPDGVADASVLQILQLR